MTAPGGRGGRGRFGDAWVTFHADTSNVNREAEEGIRRAAEDSEDDMKETGEKWGDALGDGMHERLGRRASTLHETVEREIRRRKIKVDTDFDIDEGLIPDEIERAFQRVMRPGGPVDNLERSVGQAVSSGIGAGFNVSGRGPLIALLLPFIGAIGSLIAGAVQAVNGLIALLTIVPSLIGSIVLQAGVLFLAFKGVGAAIQLAFAAKNPKEFEKALEGLTPQLQVFIRSLLPLRELFNDLADLAQRNFFGAFGDSLAYFAKFMRFHLAQAVDILSTAFGNLFKNLVFFFQDYRFQMFFAGLIDSTARWLALIGPALVELLKGFADLGITVKPFLDWFGAGIAKGIADFGKWLQDLSADPEFLAWLTDMKDTLRETWKFFGLVTEAFKAFFKAVDEGGGKETIRELGQLINEIIYYLNTDFGKKGIEGLIEALFGLAVIAVILIGGFLSFLAILAYIIDWIRVTLVPGLGTFFTETIPGILDTFIEWVKSTGPRLYGAFQAAFEAARQAVADRIEGIKTLVQSIPGRIQGAITNIGTFMYNAGYHFIQRLAQGMIDAIPGPLRLALFLVGAQIASHIPSSPAKLGPLSGEGDPLKGGQRIIQRLAAGIKMETPALAAASSNSMNSINFGPNSIQVGFNGAVPTQQQAMMTGQAVGSGITQQLALRNTTLAVRSMIGG